MDIAMIGAGAVGRALGPTLKAAGHKVTFGLRDPDDAKYADLADRATIADAAAAKVIILAMPWGAVDEVASALGGAQGRIVIDATNPLGMSEAGLGLTIGHDTSGGEQIQALLPQAMVVKCFNQIGAEFMADAAALSARPVMFAASDHEDAKAAAMTLASDAGFDAQDGGPLRNARLLEPFAMLWIWNALQGDLGREFGFAVARRGAA